MMPVATPRAGPRRSPPARTASAMLAYRHVDHHLRQFGA